MDRGNVETKQSLTNTWPETNMNINNFKAIGYVNLFLKKTTTKHLCMVFIYICLKKPFFFNIFSEDVCLS